MTRPSKTEKKRTSGNLEPGLYIVATPIGNSQDWSFRALDTLRHADIIAAEDTRTLKKHLEPHGIKPTRVVSHHEHNEEASVKGLIEDLKNGCSVALVSDAGTPVLSDPGFRLVVAAHEAGIKVKPVPGPSSLTAALSVAGLGGRSFFFGGFLPNQTEAKKKALLKSREAAEVLIYFEAPHRIRETLECAAATLGPDTKLVLCRELTKNFEEIQRGTIDSLLQTYRVNEARGEFVVLFERPPLDMLTRAETEAEIRRLLGQGRSASEILEEIRPITDLPRKEIYDLISRLKG